MFLDLLLITIVVLGIAILGMAIKIIVKKDGKFSEFRVGHNKDMARKRIACAKGEEIRDHRKRLAKAGHDCSNCKQIC